MVVIGIMLFANSSTRPDAARLRAEVAVRRTEQKYPILAACTRLDAVYDDLFYDDRVFDEWPDAYHGTVDAVISESLGAAEIACDAETYAALQTAGPALRAMAEKLPPWKDPANLERLHAGNLGHVLLEYLRVYECALVEYRFFLPVEAKLEYELGLSPVPGPYLEFINIAGEMLRRDDIIERELQTARPALERALGMLGTGNRLRPLQLDIECLQRASLDIRNASALAAEASTCLPRLWDAKDPLRDTPPDEEEI